MAEIPKYMKALVCYGKDEYRLENDFPVPEISDDEVLVKTEGCGICAGDLKTKQGAQRIWKSFAKPPFVPGHEFVGSVVATGRNVHSVKVGDRVAPEQIVPCGQCRFCKNGQYWMCEVHNTFGFQYTNNGGMAEYVRLPATSKIHIIPKNMELEKALLIEPYACSKHAVDRASINNDDVVVISGAGTLGLGMISYAKMKNPKCLIALDLKNDRLNKAKEFGADLTINPSEENAVERVKNLTEGYGCDCYIETSGHPSSVSQGLDMIRKLGTFVEFSVFSEKATIDWSIIGDEKELDVLGSHLSPYCFPFVIERLQSDELATNGVVSSFYNLDNWETAFEAATGKHGDYKVAFRFD